MIVILIVIVTSSCHRNLYFSKIILLLSRGLHRLLIRYNKSLSIVYHYNNDLLFLVSCLVLFVGFTTTTIIIMPVLENESAVQSTLIKRDARIHAKSRASGLSQSEYRRPSLAGLPPGRSLCDPLRPQELAA